MMSDTLDTSIRYIKGVGEAREKLMTKLGIHTLRDLVGYFPRAYQDRTLIKSTRDLIIGETVCVLAMASDKPRLSHIRKGLDLVKLRAVDEFGSVDITFFNQPYVKDAIRQGETYKAVKEIALEQTAEYANICGVKNAHILIYDREGKQKWKGHEANEFAEYDGVKLEIWKMKK